MVLLSHWIETLGDARVLAIGGALIGLAFGVCAQRSRYCVRAAVIESCQGQMGARFSVWFLGFAVALLATQLAVVLGWLKPETSRFIDAPGSISGALVGGLLFGSGMILTRGCASRLVILSAAGNLRALLAGLVFAVAVQATIAGWFLPLRQHIASWWPIDAGPSRQWLLALGLPAWTGLMLGLALTACALWVFQRSRQTHKQSVWSGIGAGVVGLCIAAAWVFTQAVANNSFEPIAIQGMTFAGPSAEWLMRVLSSASAPTLGFDAGLLPAAFVGSLLAAVISRDFKFEGFKTENKLGHYITGAVLMGFGAVLAMGCTVGAAMTGGAIFALTAWLTLVAIWSGAALTWKLHMRMGWAV
jgi:uncharacterized protein